MGHRLATEQGLSTQQLRVVTDREGKALNVSSRLPARCCHTGFPEYLAYMLALAPTFLAGLSMRRVSRKASVLLRMFFRDYEAQAG
jgi:hypothetical protein